MICNQDTEWQYMPVETADEVMFCGDVIESKQLINWNRWLKIRKQQHKHLGLMVCRSSTSLLMNKSDKFRSKVECKWMIDLARKLKTNNEYTCDFPHLITKELNNFTSVYIPDVIHSEKGINTYRRDNYINFEMLTPNMPLYNELVILKSLRPAKSPEKLAVIGRSINEIIKPKICYKGTIPSIIIEPEPKNKEYDNSLIIIRIDDYIMQQSINNSSECETFKLNTISKPINTVKVNTDILNEIIIENCSPISIHYKWKKEEYATTKYDSILKQQPIGCFYFDTRTNVLGPGQIKHLKYFFKPKVIGLHRETWILQVEILGKLDPIIQTKISLQGCAISKTYDESIGLKLHKAVQVEKVKMLCGKLANIIIQNVFPKNETFIVEKYQYHDDKMKQLYNILQTKATISVDELFYQCMRLEQSFREKYFDLISQTAVILLKREMIYEYDNFIKQSQHELHAHKTMYVAMDSIDLLMHTYEPDYNEVCHDYLKKNLIDPNIPKSKKSAENLKISTINFTTEQINEFAILREEWLDMMKPMMYKRLEWAVQKICDYNTQWPECKHKIHGIEKNEHNITEIGYYKQKGCSISLMERYFVNK